MIQTGNCKLFALDKKEFLSACEFVGENNKFLVCAGTDHKMDVYNVVNLENMDFKLKSSIPDLKTTVTSILKLNSEKFATGAFDNLIKIWNTTYFEVEGILSGHQGPINKIIRRNDYSIISCADDCLVKIWNIESLECDFTLNAHEGRVTDIIIFEGNNGQLLISGSEDKSLKFWDLETKDVIKEIICKTHLSAISLLSPNSLLVGDKLGNVLIYNLQSFDQEASLEAHCSEICFMKETESNSILTAGFDSLVKFFDKESGECRKVLDGHKNSILKVYEIKGKFLSVSADGCLKMWEV